MRVRGILICLLALGLAQLPWIPCHCGDRCEIRPLLVATTHACEDPEHEALHETCPAHGCTGHRHGAHPQRESAPEPDRDDDHDHDIFILQAVSAPPTPSLPVGGCGLSLAGAAPLSLAAAAIAGTPAAVTRPATGPPRGLATTRLLL